MENKQHSDSYQAIVICGNRNLSEKEIKERLQLYNEWQAKRR